MTDPTDTTKPLKGLTVIELHAIGPVPFVGMVLRQLGASVTRVSPPSDPKLGTVQSVEFDCLNAGKRSIKLDLKSTDGHQSLHELLASVDVLLEGFRPGVLEKLDLSPRQLHQHHTQLIIGRLSGFGQHGAYAKRAGHDINYLALSGILNAIGQKNTLSVPLNLIGDFGGGAMFLLVGVLAQLVRRSLSSDGAGSVVESSILGGSIGLTPMIYGLLADNRWQLERLSNLLDGGAPFYRAYRTADNRWMAVGAIENKFYCELLKLLGLTNTINSDSQHDRATWDAQASAFSEVFLQRTRDDWARDAQLLDCCVTPVLDLQEAASFAHNNDNHWFTDFPYTHPKDIVDFHAPLNEENPAK